MFWNGLQIILRIEIRTLYCKILNHTIECVTYGVLLGSLLGLLLFLIYVNVDSICCNNVKTKLFADDTNLFFHRKDLVDLFALINIGLSELSGWFTANI